MESLKVIVTVLALLFGVGFTCVLFRVAKFMPSRWMKWGLIAMLLSSVVMVNNRILALIIGFDIPAVLMLVLLGTFCLGGVIVSLSVFGFVNGHDKKIRKNHDRNRT